MVLRAFCAVAKYAFCSFAIAALLGGAFASRCSAQAVVEAAGATSVAGSVGSAIKPVFPNVTIPGAAGGAGSSAGAHLIASSAPPPQETNVRDFQMQAGKDAGKVLLRAAPVNAQIWVNGKIVGKTPMLLVLAPGKYKVEMRGARGETGSGTVDLLPRETREMQIKLQQLYPGRISYQDQK